jgi:hypothetical protein
MRRRPRRSRTDDRLTRLVAVSAPWRVTSEAVRGKTGKVKSQDLKAALDAVLDGRAPERSETKAFGCTIKRV